jgi:hypothetical protein
MEFYLIYDSILHHLCLWVHHNAESEQTCKKFLPVPNKESLKKSREGNLAIKTIIRTVASLFQKHF